MNFLKNNYLTLLLLIFAFCIYGCSKKDWSGSVTQITLPQTNNGRIYDILINQQSKIFLVGGDRYERNDFFQSNDDGYSWTICHFDAEENSNKAIFCITEFNNTLFASGYDGKIFTNETLQPNGWHLRSSEFWWYSFTGSTFTENGNAYFAGNWGYPRGLIVRTNEHLSNKKIDSFPYAINDISFVDNQTGYAVGYGALLQTLDGGDTWQQLNLTDDNYRSICVLDKNNIWTVGFNGSIVHITENGRKFNKIKNSQNPLGNADRYLSITFNGLSGYITGEKGLVLQTSNSGKSWQKMKPFTNNDLYKAAFHPVEKTVFFVGDKNTIFKYYPL
ncbi:MAG TPA: YCF48-related protein [Edaphocola sp.]|nr:YCF48-related protein [Edaphocola sp.]